MWQALLAAAVAGSTGLVAKHLFKPSPDSAAAAASDPLQDEERDLEDHADVPMIEVSTVSVTESPVLTDTASESERKGIFRFSSSGGRGGVSSRFGVKNLKKKTKVRCFGFEKGDRVKKCGEGSNKMEFFSKQRKDQRKIAVCSKRRKTNKNLADGKCGSCSHKAGKAQINKLNTSMDETVRVVHELQTELHKRKSAHNLPVSSVAMTPEPFSGQSIKPEFDISRAEDKAPSEIKIPRILLFEDNDCGSSILTEEMEPGMRDFYYLEAELESELEKLPWCASESSYRDAQMPNLGEVKGSGNDFHDPEIQTPHVPSSQGVLPAELDNRLCHLLINQQENQIVELESELQSAQSKLKDKEAELEALKDCVRRLTEISLAGSSDDEPEADPESDAPGNWSRSSELGSEEKKSTVGMKRPMISASDLCNYCTS